MHRSTLLVLVLSGFLAIPLAVSAESKIRVNLSTDRTLTVRDAPAGTKIGSQRGGNEGTLVGSPQTAGGRSWQQVDFDNPPAGGPDGWVASEFLMAVGSLVPDCIEGNIPQLDANNFQKDRVPIAPGATHIYCLPYIQDAGTLNVFVVDMTGPTQCLEVAATVYPPAESNLASRSTSGKGARVRYATDPVLLPKGTYRVSITAGDDPGCAYRYRVAATFWAPFAVPTLPPPPPDQLQKGARVEVATDLGVSLTVRETAGGNKVGSQPRGAKGIIQEDPQEKSSYTWWKVDFDPQGPDKKDGWVAGKYLVPVGQQQQTADCPQGELPPARGGVFTGFENWWGKDRVHINQGETHTYCFTAKENSNRLDFTIADRTGAAQCFQHFAEFIPPAGSGVATESGSGRDTAYTFFWYDRNVPKGVWRVRLTAESGSPCLNLYQIVAHY